MTITHYNTTWEFSGSPTWGYFVNGEPWIVGPVDLIGVTPNNNAVWDETYPGEVGPNSGTSIITVPNVLQGYFTKHKYVVGYPAGIFYYDATKDLSRLASPGSPVTLNPGQMIFSSTGQDQVYGSLLNEVVRLTILDAPADPEDFCPAMYNADEDRAVQFNHNTDVDYGIWPNFPHDGVTMLTTEQADSYSPALPFCQYNDGANETSHLAINNAGYSISYPNTNSGYGREVMSIKGQVALWLCMNNSNATKKKAFVKMIQDGIDISSYISAGGTCKEPGGHMLGRRISVFIAGLALNDATILAIAADNNHWQETITTFLVEMSDVGRDVSAGESAEYTLDDVGLYDWGWKHNDDDYSDDRRWYGLDPEDGGGQIPGYRFVQWGVSAAGPMIAKFMGALTEWNSAPSVGYTERFMDRVGTLGDPIYDSMYNAFWDATTLQPPNVSVEGTGSVNNRSSYHVDSPRQITLSAFGLSDNLYYRIDGGSWILYSGSFEIATGCTLGTKNTKTGMDDSTERETIFTFSTGGQASAVLDLVAVN